MPLAKNPVVGCSLTLKKLIIKKGRWGLFDPDLQQQGWPVLLPRTSVATPPL